ncbi:putative hydrophobic protein (TIGR00341 family) [Blastomonas natatoria]|uniref:Putative hydrophobic protein (TIGR00341 family) n=1 Tax=Blastomonas natatoria TaxID=34015 RepID=A0A2V3V6V4_9SPHN|nr:TIGR00341 family protein [Blastomonas natatoria]PXW77513.1 putative hydrophobic protein (TIGR00341 family) [Blastomonas natatoria]
MSARIVQIYLPEDQIERLETILPRHTRRFWRETLPGAQEKYTCIVQQRYTERLLIELEEAFAAAPSFTAHVALLEAVFPAIEEDPTTELPLASDLPPPTRLERFFSRDRLSTDEIYDDIAQSLQIRPSFVLTVMFSAIIAGLGMRSGQVAVVIGAMIIAPLLGPTMGIALAATVGNWKLGRQAIITLALGCALAVLSGVVIGAILPIDPQASELRNRTLVQPSDIALALACGAAGVLAFSRGASLSLVGVMVAVALVPPLTAAGMYTGAGLPHAGASAMFLFTVNLVCVNVAGILTFLFQGLPPKSWRMTMGIMLVWLLILTLLMSMMAGTIFLGIGSWGSPIGDIAPVQ